MKYLSIKEWTRMVAQGHIDITFKIYTMKRFNKSIKIEVSVDDIANDLLSTMKEDEKHSSIIVEAIIGTALNSGTMSYIYNALNGHLNEVDFKVGDLIVYNHRYKATEEADYKIHQTEMEVLEVDNYSSAKLKIKGIYTSYAYGKVKEQTFKEWVNHTDGSRVKITKAIA